MKYALVLLTMFFLGCSGAGSSKTVSSGDSLKPQDDFSTSGPLDSRRWEATDSYDSMVSKEIGTTEYGDSALILESTGMAVFNFKPRFRIKGGYDFSEAITFQINEAGNGLHFGQKLYFAPDTYIDVFIARTVDKVMAYVQPHYPGYDGSQDYSEEFMPIGNVGLDEDHTLSFSRFRDTSGVYIYVDVDGIGTYVQHPNFDLDSTLTTTFDVGTSTHNKIYVKDFSIGGPDEQYDWF